MSYTNNFVRLTFGGEIYAGADIWSCGFNLSPTDGSTLPIGQAELTAFLAAANEPIAEWMQSGNSAISTNAELQWAKAALLDEEGKYIGDSEVYEYPAGINGDYSNATPPQISTVISLTTSFSRGLAHIGRIYPPLNGFIGPSGLIPAQYTDYMGNAAALMIAGINEAAHATLDPSMSVSVMSKVGTGVTRLVTGVRVGNVLDTQRSRRNAFTETYTYNPLPQF